MTIGRNQSMAALARDAALARLGRTRRWVIAGSAALTAGFAALVSAVAPGRTLTSKQKVSGQATASSRSTHGAGAEIPSMPAPATAGDLGLQGPNEAPQPVPSQPQDPAQPSPLSAPAPQTSTPSAQAPQTSGGGGVVSGGS